MSVQKYPKYLEKGTEFSGWLVVAPVEEKNVGRKVSKWFYKCVCKVCGDERIFTKRSIVSCKKANECSHTRVTFTTDGEGTHCTCCKQFKEWRYFSKDKNRISGRSPICKECMNKANRERHAQQKAGSWISLTSNFLKNDEGRECTTCGKFKIWDEFNNDVNGVYGKAPFCKSCVSEKSKQQYRDKLESEGKVLQRVGNIFEDGRICTGCRKFKTWDHFGANKGRTTGKNCECKICANKKSKQYTINNLEKVKQRRALRYRERKATDLNFKITVVLRGRMGMALKSASSKKFHHSMDLIGCSPAECIAHLNDNDFGYNFEDHGFYGLHVDHIIPCAFFDLTKEVEQLICFNWKNQRLCPWRENLEKYDKLDEVPEGLYIEIQNDVLERYPELAEDTEEVCYG